MGEYLLTSPMLSIPMEGADVVLGVQWLQSLATIAFNFQELFIRFSTEGKEVELRGIAGKPGKIISSNGMTMLLKKEQRVVIAQLCSLDVSTLESSIYPDLQKVLDNHSKVFETPKGLPPMRDHDHAIYLIPGSVPPNIRPYRYTYMEGSVIPPFSQRQPFDPLCLFIRYKATKMSFQTFVYYLSFPIRLRMIR